MAASKTKAVLFTTAKLDRKVHMWPVAAFNTVAQARSHAALLKMAYRTGNDELVKSLDPTAHADESGKYDPKASFAVTEVPYSPTLSLDDDEPAEDAPAAT